jgi:hypothetical protein
MPTISTFMGLQIPIVGADSNAWGGYLNTDLGLIDLLAVYNVVNVSTTSSLTVANGPTLVKATGGGPGITLTLPNATVAANVGRVYIVTKVDAAAGVITIQGFGGQTINGAATFVLSTQWASITLQSDGSNWVAFTAAFNLTPTFTSVTTTGLISVGTALTSPIITSTANLHVVGTLEDGLLSFGTSGQVLSSTGTGTEWISVGIPPLTGPSNSVFAAGSSGLVAAELASAGTYALLGAAAVTNSDGSSTTISGGNIGSYPTNTITPAGWTLLGGTTVVTATAQNQADLQTAISFYQGLTSTAIGASFSTTTFTATSNGYNGGPGFVGQASSALHFTGGTVTLDGAGLTNPVFVFLIGSSMTVDTGITTFNLINGATAANVVWVNTTSATFTAQTGGNWAGSVLAGSSITLGGGTLNGRALAHTGAVTISIATIITVPAASSPAFTSTPTLTTLTTTGAIVAGTTLKAGSFTVAGLPAGTEGQIAYATNGRKVGEGPGNGTGVPVYYSTQGGSPPVTGWHVFSTDTLVQA